MEKDETLHTLGPIGPEFQEIPVALKRRLYAGLRHYAGTYTGIDDPERSFDLQLLMFTFLLHFLWTAFHPSEKFIAALADLRFAIESLGQGRETPFIRPQRRRGRPPMPVAAENDLALACVLIELYMRKGL